MQTIGIYSFPKSGNTWMRHIIASALGQTDIGTAIPDVHQSPVPGPALEHGEKRLRFYKSHHLREQTDYEGEAFRNTKIIYVLRHPLDVFISFVNQLSGNVRGNAAASGLLFSYDSIEEIHGTERFDLLFATYCALGTLMPRSSGPNGFGSWFTNAESFTGLARREKRVKVVRYEDMFADFDGTVGGVLRWIGLHDVDTAALRETVEGATKQDGRFFWKKQTGTHREYLTDEQINLFASLHGKRCAALGYDLTAAATD